MRTIILYRDDFKVVSNVSTFEDVLRDLNIAPAKWDKIDEIEITINTVKYNGVVQSY